VAFTTEGNEGVVTPLLDIGGDLRHRAATALFDRLWQGKCDRCHHRARSIVGRSMGVGVAELERINELKKPNTVPVVGPVTGFSDKILSINVLDNGADLPHIES
jgi:hypothetical protein